MTDKNVLKEILKIEDKKARILEIERQMAGPDFWSDREKSTILAQEFALLKDIVERFENAETDEDFSRLEIEAKFSGPYDSGNCVLSIYAGAGGTEAQDWAEMLKRMYHRFAQNQKLKIKNQNYKVEEIDETKGEEAGIKHTMLKITGPRAYGLLKHEAGVHRLVRLSPFDADHGRHTSFALVEVLPDLSDEQEKKIEINENDLRIETFGASGRGGQNVNKVETAVRITHLPTKITVTCQSQRHQAKNKDEALKILKSKLTALLLEKNKQRIDELKSENLAPSWGNQIRNYVLHPYKQVKDLRTGFESKDPEKVLDGEIGEFIEAEIQSDL